MTFHRTPLGIDVDLRLADEWVSIVEDVRQSAGITIDRGGGFDSSSLEASRGQLLLDNRAGKYMLRNPMGEFYGLLQRNNEIRVSRRLIEAGFSQTVSGAWPDTDTGQPPRYALPSYAWSTFGSGGTVQASDWSSASGVGRHSVPVDNAHRQSYLSTVSHRNIEVLATFQLSVADVTGVGGIRCSIILRGQSTSEYLHVGVIIPPSENVLIDAWDANGATIATATPPATGIVHTGQRLRLCACIDGEWFRAKIWPADQDEPADWLIDDHILENRLISEPGWIGLRTGVLPGVSNTMPIVVSWDDLVVRSPRIYGVVPDWPTEWDTSLNDSYAPIEIAGITRRLDDNDSPLQSALRRSIPNVPGLIAYWPCEDGRDATQLASALPGAGPMNIAGGDVNLATSNDFKASSPLPTVNSSRWGGTVSDFTATGAIQTRYLMAVPSGGTVADAIISQTYTYAGGSATVGLWEVIYRSGGLLAVRAWTTSGAIAFTSSDFGFDVNGKLLRVSLELTQDGADVDWSLATLEVGAASAGSVGGTLAGHTLGGAVDIRVAVGNVMTDVTFGHIMVQSQITILQDLWQELNAYAGETAGRRLERLCEEESVPFAYVGDLDTTAAMGPQLPGKLQDLLIECADADRGYLYETRTAAGYTYRTLASLYSQTSAVGLDLSSRHVAPPLRPDDDTSRVYNDVTVERVDGSSARAVQDTGPLAVSRIGRKPKQFDLNLDSDVQLPDTASWILHLSTIDEPSFPSIAVNLAHPAISGDDILSSQILDMELADRLTIQGAAALKIFDPINQLPSGYTETLNAYEHSVRWNTFPEKPYHVLTLDDITEFGRLDSGASTLENGINSSQTTFTVAVGDNALWTEDAGDLPLDIIVGGERMTVTAISTTTTPSFVGFGAPGHADNASVGSAQGLALPTGVTTGDKMLIFAAARDLAASPTLPTDYSELFNLGNVRIYGKEHDGSEPVPTIGITGGSAGVTLSAQMCALRNVPLTVRTYAQQFNGSAQDIAMPGLGYTMGKSIALGFGWKQDDFTSVATRTGRTEIAEASTTVGNDQSLVWDYQSLTGTAALSGDSFVVTGGAAAISRAFVLAFGNHQTFTVTRSVNGVVKTHSAGAEVHVADTVYLGR